MDRGAYRKNRRGKIREILNPVITQLLITLLRVLKCTIFVHFVHFENVQEVWGNQEAKVLLKTERSRTQTSELLLLL